MLSTFTAKEHVMKLASTLVLAAAGAVMLGTVGLTPVPEGA